MEFNWDGFTEADFTNYCISVNNGSYNDTYDDIVGSVRVGELCFELCVDNDTLCYDLYVGGVDSRYGYGRFNGNAYPYDLISGYATRYGLCEWMTYEQFKQVIEIEFIWFIKTKEPFYSLASLTKKANEPLCLWKGGNGK